MLPIARPYPAVQSGGINAVAIATPGTTLVLILLDVANIPATPPKKATNRSKMLGCVRDNNSGTSSVGVILKNI